MQKVRWISSLQLVKQRNGCWLNEKIGHRGQLLLSLYLFQTLLFLVQTSVTVRPVTEQLQPFEDGIPSGAAQHKQIFRVKPSSQKAFRNYHHS